MLTLTQFECFVAVAEELHFGAAAERLRMTQPPLSRQIRLLERELGTLVFERTSRRVRLTPAGDALLPHARRMLELTERARGAVRAVADGRGGSVTLSYTSLAAQTVLARVVRAVDAELPDVALELREHVTVDQLGLLRSGAVDLALLRPTAQEDGVSSRRVQTEPMVLALAADHPLALRPEIGLDELAGFPLVGYASVEARYLDETVRRVFLAAGAAYRPTHSASQVATVLALVAAGVGFGIVPASAALLRHEGVAFVPLALPSGANRLAVAELEVAWRPDALSPAASSVLDVLSQLTVRDGADHAG